MAQIFVSGNRRGLITTGTLVMPTRQTGVEVRMPFTPPTGTNPVAVRMRIEQSADGVLWYPFCETLQLDMRALSETRDKDGNLITELVLRGEEQIYRHDIYAQFPDWEQAHDLIGDDGAHYHQLALCPQCLAFSIPGGMLLWRIPPYLG